MKDIFDSKLQELLNAKNADCELTSQEKQDVQIYEKLIHILDNEPAPEVPQDFYKQVSRAIHISRDKRLTSILYCLFGLLILFAAYFLISLLNNQAFILIVDTFFQYRWIFIFSLFAIIMIQFADKRIVAKN
jgi:hypothetical protein